MGDPFFDVLQWFAFAASVAAAWLVASDIEGRRKSGFWIFLVSNVLWIGWGLHSQAYALMALQVCLAAMNVRGLRKNREA